MYFKLRVQPMSSSRGLLPLSQRFSRSQPKTPSLIWSRTVCSFAFLSTSKAPFQIYRSGAHDPYINLSLENYLFETTPENSTVLLLYTNTPSVIIGRNQNPWAEVNLPLLRKAAWPGVNLLRRYSGGGTVFHDVGNVNYCIITPSAQFDRDKHAQMIVRALHKLGVEGATVNKRHDIVLLPPGMKAESTKMEEEPPEGARKISGSAFKVSRLRSYHHGTMLLDSKLEDIGAYLRSPAKGWLEATGVDSVRSPVANVGVGKTDFANAVISEFGRMYLGSKKLETLYKALNWKGKVTEELELGVCIVRNTELHSKEMKKGIEKLKSPKWIYGQTPQLTFSVPPPSEPSEPSEIVEGVQQPPNNPGFTITANKGIIQSVSTETYPALDGLVGKMFDGGVINDHLANSKHARGSSATEAVGGWIMGILGRTEWGKQ